MTIDNHPGAVVTEPEMPNSRKKKKSKSPKFKKETNQPDLTKYVGTPQQELNDIKKRTPPSREDTPAKKLNMSVEDPEQKMDIENDETTDSDCSSENTDTSVNGDNNNSKRRYYTRTTRR